MILFFLHLATTDAGTLFLLHLSTTDAVILLLMYLATSHAIHTSRDFIVQKFKWIVKKCNYIEIAMKSGRKIKDLKTKPDIP